MRVDEDITDDIVASIKDFQFSNNTVITEKTSVVEINNTQDENSDAASDVMTISDDTIAESVSWAKETLGNIRDMIQEKKETASNVDTSDTTSNSTKTMNENTTIQQENNNNDERENIPDTTAEVYPTTLSEKDMAEIRALMGNLQ